MKYSNDYFGYKYLWIQEPLQAFHIFNLKKDENQKNNSGQQYLINEAVKNTPKIFNTNVLMIIG